jgi:tetratricopeptide (TPR) repeat protein
MSYLQEDETRLRKLRAREAIALAIQSRWEEAVEANQEIIEAFPNDVDAYNRLGRALMELGRYQEAREAYQKALAMDSHNQIARKNLARLDLLKEAAAANERHRVALHLFLQETGKAGIVNLIHLAPPKVLAHMAAGDQVYLRPSGQRLWVADAEGTSLGEVEPHYAVRLLELMKGGNQYSAAVASLKDKGIQVIIKETYQDPSQMGRLSFPVKETESVRPYVQEAVFRYEAEEEEPLPAEGEFTEEAPAEEAAAEPGFEDNEEEEEE